jgi:hypothetical protein
LRAAAHDFVRTQPLLPPLKCEPRYELLFPVIGVVAMYEPESALTLQEARALFPGRPSLQTVWRWVAGLELPSGEIIKLASFKSGGRRYVHRSAIQAFLDAQNAEGAIPVSTRKKPMARRRRDANRRAAAHGVR